MARKAKTVETDLSVEDYLCSIDNEQRRADCRALTSMMATATEEPPVMWGPGIVGFGKYRYTYESGHSGEAALAGFAARSRQIALYIMSGFEMFDDLLSSMGKFTTGKSCLYIVRLADVDNDVLQSLIQQSANHMRDASDRT
jgi:hypothetical protein